MVVEVMEEAFNNPFAENIFCTVYKDRLLKNFSLEDWGRLLQNPRVTTSACVYLGVNPIEDRVTK